MHPAIHPGSILNRSSGLNKSHVRERSTRDQSSFSSSQKHIWGERSKKLVSEIWKFDFDNQVSIDQPPCFHCCLDAREESKVLNMEKKK